MTNFLSLIGGPPFSGGLGAIAPIAPLPLNLALNQDRSYLVSLFFQDLSPDDFNKLLEANRTFNLALVATISICVGMAVFFIGFRLCNRMEALREYWLKDKGDHSGIRHELTEPLPNEVESMV